MKDIKVDQIVLVEMVNFFVKGRILSLSHMTFTVDDEFSNRREIIWKHHVLNVDILG
jgi:hypothetical protein